MADVFDELIAQGTVDPQALADQLRRESEHGLLASLSGSKRLMPTGDQLRADSLKTGAGIGDARAATSLAEMKAAMEAAQRHQDRLARMAEGDLNRQNRLDVAGMRESGAMKRALIKANKGGAKGDPRAAFETQLAHLEDLAGVADEAQKRSSGMNTGYMANLGFIKGSPASRLDEYLTPLRSEEALSKLSELRTYAASLGQKGSGLGQVTEREIMLLQGARRSLELAQGEEQLDAALAHLAAAHRRAAKNIRAELRKLGGGSNMSQSPAPTQTGGAEFDPDSVADAWATDMDEDEDAY